MFLLIREWDFFPLLSALCCPCHRVLCHSFPHSLQTPGSLTISQFNLLSPRVFAELNAEADPASPPNVSLTFQVMKALRMSVGLLPSSLCRWMSTCRGRLCSTARCRATSPPPSWATSNLASNTRWVTTDPSLQEMASCPIPGRVRIALFPVA